MEDIQKIKRDVTIKFIGPYNPDYSDKIIYSTIEEAYNYLKDKLVIGLDIETTVRQPLGTYKNENIYQPGLDPYLSKVVMLQIGDTDNIYVIDTRTVDISPLYPLWQIKERIWVGHNLKFEAKHLLYNYDIIHQTVWDCMLVEQNLYNGLGFRNSLEALAERYLNVKPVQKTDLFTVLDEEQNEEDSVFIDKSTRMGFLTIGNKPFTEKQILYGSDDILYPLIIRKEQMKGVGNYNPIELHKLENKFCLCLADIELVGMTFNKEIWLDTFYKNKVVYHHRTKKLNQYVEKKYPKFCSIPDLFGTPPGCIIQWSSSKQVIEFFRYLGICPKEKSKQTGRIEFTVGAKSLVKQLSNPYKEKYNNDEETDIVTEEDLVLNYLLLKVSEQACTTFGEEWLKYIHPITGRVHSSYKQILNTGRMCVDVDTLIDTNIGYIRIGSLIPAIEGTLKWPEGIKAKTHTGEYHKITHGINKGIEEMYRVTLESGHEIICTMEHKFLTEKGWYSLKEIVSSPTEHTILYDESY